MAPGVVTECGDALWCVVGGSTSGGIIVRTGESLTTAKLPARLEHGALLKALSHDVQNRRMRFQKLSGAGPAQGWVSMTCRGRQLIVRVLPEDRASVGVGPPRCGRLPRCLQLRSAVWSHSRARMPPIAIRLALVCPSWLMGLDEHPLALLAPFLLPPARALLFGGEGSQYVMMLSSPNFPVLNQMFKVAEEILGYDVRHACMYGPEGTLSLPEYSQPAVYIAGLAALAKLRDKQPEVHKHCHAAAGMRVGELAALTAAEVFDFTVGIHIIKARLSAIEQAAGDEPLTHLPITFLTREQVAALCQEHTSGPQHFCRIECVLFTSGIVCVGTREAVEQVREKAIALGSWGGDRSNIYGAPANCLSGRCHAFRLELAKSKFAESLHSLETKMRRPKIQVYMTTARWPIGPETTTGQIIELLVAGLDLIDWDCALRQMFRDGISQFVSCGHGLTMRALVRKARKTGYELLEVEV